MSKPKLPPDVVPENSLEKLLVMASEDPESRPHFCRELLKSDVITLGKPAAGYMIPEGYQTVEKELRFDLRLLD